MAMMTLPTSDFEGMSVAEFDTKTLLAHAAEQARQRQYDKLFIVDVDSHHYESAAMKDIINFIDNPVMKQMAQSAAGGGARTSGVLPQSIGYQDQSGRVTRYPLRPYEKTPPSEERDVELTRRWMDAMGVDQTMLFPTPMLQLSFHPLVEMQVALARAYNKWFVERVCAVEPRIRTLCYLPLHDPDASLKMIEDFGDKPGVSGFVVVATHDVAVHDNRLMKVYAALEERNLPIAFHAHFNWKDGMMKQFNRFISTHALGFTFYNMVHLTNWVINGIPERFPKLKTIWMESGLAWIPFMMQRLDNEYLMRSNECPLLTKKPSDYMRDFYYSSQPMEITDITMLEQTFRMINADTQLLFSSDYPHWDFDLPSTIYDLPFLSDQSRKNILGENAARVFGLEIPKTKMANIPGLARE
jgi:predicted TIM-barrel fold metal-dependent hydrolase